MKKSALVFGLLLVSFFILYPSAHAETIRERATLHFSMDEWSVRNEAVPHVEKQGLAIPGGYEAFSGISARPGATPVAIYPEAEGLGSIAYPEISPSLLSFLGTFGESIQSKAIESSQCSADRPFLAPLTVYRLEKLPPITAILFSNPEAVSDTVKSVRYRLTVKKDGNVSFVFLDLLIAGSDDQPIADDIVFDGVSYAGAAQQD